MANALYKWEVKTTSKVDQAAKLLKIYCILNNIEPSHTAISVCAYIFVYGYTKRVKEGILRAGILNKESSLRNAVSELKKLGLLEGSAENVKVASRITQNAELPITPVTALLIKLDNN
jgi:hypothetical protein